MTDALTQTTVTLALCGWMAFCGVVWMLGRHMHSRAKRGDINSPKAGAIWLRKLAGAGPEQESLNIPMAMAQVIALASAAVAIGAASCLLIFGSPPFLRVGTSGFYALLLAAPVLLHALTEAAVLIWRSGVSQRD